MLRIGALALAFLSALVAYDVGRAQEPQSEAAKDLKKIQGEWIITAMEVNGANVAQNRLEGTVLTIKDDRYIIKRKDETTTCKITLDPVKDPKEIDMLFLDGATKDGTLKGIYKITAADTFQIVRGLAPEQNRPRDFATWPDTNYFLITWKKK